MQPIPQPELLDPDRVLAHERDEMTLAEHRSRAQQLDEALHQSCAYATMLWQHLDVVRRYLYESLPSDPRAPGINPRVSAAPVGPADDAGWEHWIDTTAAVTSVLAGPHGDSGFGLDEAKRAAQRRRDAPDVGVLAGIAAERAESQPEAPEDRPITKAPEPGSATPSGSLARSIGLAALVILALRGLTRGRAR